MRSLVCLMLCIAALSASSRALAQSSSSNKIQVLAIASEQHFKHAQALSIALKRAVTRTEGWTLGKGDFSLEVMTLALGCKIPPNADCQDKIGKKVGTKRYVWGSLTLEDAEAVADLHLWEDGAEARSYTLRYSKNLTDPSDDALLEIAEGAFAQLLGNTEGVVVVSAEGVKSGDVFVDGEKVGTLRDGRLELTVAAGKHQFVLKSPGHKPARVSSTIRAGARHDVTLAPTPKAAVAGDDPQQDSSSSGTSTNKILGYGGLAVGGALTLAGGYFWLKSYMQTQDDAFEQYRAQTPPDQDACDNAKSQGRSDIVDICDSNDSHKSTARILMPVGLVVTGIGAYFLLTDDSSESEARTQHKPRVRPLVGVGPRGGQVTVDVTF